MKTKIPFLTNSEQTTARKNKNELNAYEEDKESSFLSLVKIVSKDETTFH
jgi:hypothetical protein